MNKIPEKYLRLITPLIEAAIGFLEEGQGLVPIAFIGTLDYRLCQVVLGVDSQENKDRAAASIQTTATLIHADFIFIITEAWQLIQEKAEIYKEILKEYGTVSNTPSGFRTEIISFTIETHEGMWAAQCPTKLFSRLPSKRTIVFPEFEFCKELEGRFVGLLPKQ